MFCFPTDGSVRADKLPFFIVGINRESFFHRKRGGRVAYKCTVSDTDGLVLFIVNVNGVAFLNCYRYHDITSSHRI